MCSRSASLNEWNEIGEAKNFNPITSTRLSKSKMDTEVQKVSSRFSIWFKYLFKDIQFRILIINSVISSFVSITMFLLIYGLRAFLFQKLSNYT